MRTLREKTEHLVDRFGEPSVISYLLQVEEQLRGQVVEMARNVIAPVPWGIALLRALKENRELWTEWRDNLRGKSSGAVASAASLQDKPPPALRAPAQGVPSQPKSKGSPKQPKTQQVTQAADASTRPQTATHLDNGTRICKKWNDSRGCAATCPDGNLHGCGIVLGKSGRVCGRSDHSRRGHLPASHGAVALRS